MTPLWRKTQRQPVADLHWATSDLALWRGPNTQEWKAIRSTGIDCVLDLRAEVESQSDLATAHNITYRQAGIKEFTAPSPEVLAAEAGWVHENIEAGRRVLVVCREGRGRSAMVCCAALVAGGLPLHEAYRLVAIAQPHVALSESQSEALTQFARSWPEGTA